MSLQKYAKPLDLKPAYSKKLFFVLLTAHILAVISLLFPMYILWIIRVVLLFAVGISAWQLLYKNKITDIKTGWWKSHGEFDLELVNGNKINAQLLPGSVVTEWLVILHLNCSDNKKRCWLLMDDALDTDVYRRLCIRLRQFSFDTTETELF